MTLALGTAAALLVAGCTGHGRFDLIPLAMNDLDPARSLIIRFHPSECYYRLDTEDRIRVAMRYRNLALFGPLSRVTVTLSLLLGEPPAGRARTYRLRGQGLRGWARAGAELHRFRSTSGIAVIHDVHEHDLRGRFRCLVRHQSGNALTGWRGNAALLLLGEFHAVHNEDMTRELEAQSGAGDWTRAAAPHATATIRPATTRPLTQPAPSPDQATPK